MNIETRKEEFVEEFLKFQSEAVISRFENMLQREKSSSEDLMTEKKLNERIDKSEADFKNGRYKTTSELLAKYR